MRIGELASETSVSVQTLRYYERRGLLPAPERRTSGFRVYTDDATRRVRFIRRAQDLGFTLLEIRDLLALWEHSSKSCSTVERKARATLERIDSKVRDLKRMRTGLAQYVNACQHRATLDECPLLQVLGEGEGAVT
jgi:MerR family transcriptional regulator, copper efflux regulator